jgi:hypothetical protein
MHEMKYAIQTAHWRVPSEARAFDGWLEGNPTQEQRIAVLAEVARQRENWIPSSEAWSQVRDLERFIGQRVRIQFWDPIMFLLEEEGPYPMLADCRGIALLRHLRFLQAYLILDCIEELPNSSGYSPAGFLVSKKERSLTLAPIAELAEVATVTSTSPSELSTREEYETNPSEDPDVADADKPVELIKKGGTRRERDATDQKEDPYHDAQAKFTTAAGPASGLYEVTAATVSGKGEYVGAFAWVKETPKYLVGLNNGGKEKWFSKDKYAFTHKPGAVFDVHKKTNASAPKQSTEREVIIELGAEGGSITLHGIRTERGWWFLREAVECIDEDSNQEKSAFVDSWEAALKLLDRYTWAELYPISIHPDFRKQIWVAVRNDCKARQRPQN